MYTVVASYARRSQMEANSAKFRELYPTGWWWITGSNLYEYRVPVKEEV